MRILMFLGFLVLSVLVPVGLAQAEMPAPPGWQASGSRQVDLLTCVTDLENMHHQTILARCSPPSCD